MTNIKTTKIRIPIIFDFDELDFDTFLEFVQTLNNKFVDKKTKIKLGRLHYETILDLPRVQRVGKEVIQSNVIKHLMALEGKEITIGTLYKRDSTSIGYKTFKRYMTELALNGDIITRRKSGTGGNTTMVSIKHKPSEELNRYQKREITLEEQRLEEIHNNHIEEEVNL